MLFRKYLFLMDGTSEDIFLNTVVSMEKGLNSTKDSSITDNIRASHPGVIKRITFQKKSIASASNKTK
jgi:hypothetical protein